MHPFARSPAGKVLSVLSLAVACLCCPQSAYTDSASGFSDPLPAWNDRAAKKQILDFVHEVTLKGGPDYIPVSERIATFDQDGTILVEKPFYAQFEYAMDSVKKVSAKHPEWATEQPFATILKNDQSALDKMTIEDTEKMIEATHPGISEDGFHKDVADWVATKKHSRFDKVYPKLVYEPMLELMRYLRANDFQTYIVTGSGQEFVRSYAEEVFGVPPQQIAGTTERTKFVYDTGGAPKLMRTDKLMFVCDRGGKVEAINLVIGRHTCAAFGNSTGDRQMLEWAQSGKGKRLLMLVHHDDAAREYDYGLNTRGGRFTPELMAEAKQRGWVVISMKDDWKQVFP